MTDRFGAEKAATAQYSKENTQSTNDSPWDRDHQDATAKAEVYEIWCKTSNNVYWMNPGSPELLDEKEDPLELRNFYPCPPFLLANCTTTQFLAVSDFHLAQDLYTEIDDLERRISLLRSALKVVGVYDSSADGVKRMLEEGFNNDLIPVDN